MMKGIDIISGFNVKSASPIDVRMVAETREEMNSIENTFEGLIVVCLEDKKIYLYLNGKFEEYSGSVSNNAFTYEFNFKLSNDANSIENYLIRT